MAITTDRIKMLDILNYLPAGTSLDSYLTTYLGGCECWKKCDQNCTSQNNPINKDKKKLKTCKCEIQCVCGLGKGFFPYEYMDNFNILNETTLPPINAFDSDFRGTIMSKTNYERVKLVWNHYEMKTVKDLLVWYNNLDVQLMVKAIKKQREMNKEFGLDIFTDAVSLPGLAEKVMYSTCYNNLESIPRQFGKKFSFAKNRYEGYKTQDQAADREFNLTIEHLNNELRKQHYSCSMCKCALTQENVSADRINIKKGHIDGNITMTCINCNVARKDMAISRFRYQKKIEYNSNKLIYSIDNDNKDIYYKMKANIIGGPSIIFNSFAKRNETTIRGTKMCKKIIGYDANALYLWALGNVMPWGRLTTIEPYDNIIDDINNDKLFGFLE